jgi:hypothetical protein
MAKLILAFFQLSVANMPKSMSTVKSNTSYSPLPYATVIKKCV